MDVLTAWEELDLPQHTQIEVLRLRGDKNWIAEIAPLV